MKIQARIRPFAASASKIAALLLAVAASVGVAKAQETGTNPPGTAEAVASATITVDNNQIVALNGYFKWGTSTLCHIKLDSAQSSDVTAIIVNPPTPINGASKHLLSFSTGSGADATGETLNADGTLTIVVPKDGATTKNFYINGANGSGSVGDAPIEAHQDSVSGATLGTTSATVYWYQNTHMVVSKGPGNYSIYPTSGSTYLVPSTSPAVYMSGRLLSQPIGVDVPNIQVSVVQNAVAPNAFTTAWDNVTWPMPIANDSVQVFPQYQDVNKLAATADDVVDSAPGPVYDGYYSFKYGEYKTNDTPSLPSAQSYQLDVKTSKGALTQVMYTRLLSQNIDADFADWSVLYNTGLTQDPNNLQAVIQPMLQASWSLHVGTGKTSTTASSIVNDQPVSSSPILTTDKTKFANNAARSSYSGMGTPFTISGPKAP